MNSQPVKTEETVSHHQNNKNIKEVGTPPVQSNLCTSLIAVSRAVQSKDTKTASEKWLLKPEAKESPAPPLFF